MTLSTGSANLEVPKKNVEPNGSVQEPKFPTAAPHKSSKPLLGMKRAASPVTDCLDVPSAYFR